MSYTETHFGKLKKIETEKSIEDWCKDRLNKNGVTEIPSYYGTWKETLNDYEGEKVFIINDQIWEAVEHTELEEGDDVDIFTQNEDGTISFVTQFYNGSTCLPECIEDGLERLLK